MHSLLLQTGITSAQHALLLLESVIQKKGRVASIERVVAEMLQYVGPCNEEAGGVLKVAAGQSSSAVVAMLVDWGHRDKETLDLQVCRSFRLPSCVASPPCHGDFPSSHGPCLLMYPRCSCWDSL